MVSKNLFDNLTSAIMDLCFVHSPTLTQNISTPVTTPQLHHALQVKPQQQAVHGYIHVQ